MRKAWAVAAGAGVAVIGGLILGEYELSPVTALVAGLLFGLAVAEVMAWAGGRPVPMLAVAAAVLAGAGMLWAGWIVVRHTGRGVSGGMWAGAALAAIAAAARLRPGTGRSAGSGTPTGP